MSNNNLDGIESIRVMRSQGHLSLIGIESGPLHLECDREPEVRRDGATAEVFLASDGEIRIPPGVAVEIVECSGYLDIENFAGNLAIGRVAGHLSASNVGSIAIRGNVEGRCSIENAGALAGRCVKGDLFVDGARSLSFDLVAGDVTCAQIAGEVSVEQIGGRCSLEQVGEGFRSHAVGGKLEAERVHSIKVDTVGGKLRASQAGDLSVATVGGKAGVDGAGNVSIGTVGGHASVRSVSGNVAIARVGGAARLSGDFAAGSSWNVKSGGRMVVELKDASSVALEAIARSGRVRVYGIEGELRFAGHDRLSATFGAGECKLALESNGSDIIIEGEGARSRAGAHFRWRDLGAPFENLAENLGDEIPEMVAGIVGAAGRIAAETGSFSGGVVREVARGVGEAMREVEREISDLKREVPEEAGEKLSALGRRISEIVDQALEARRSRSRAEAERIRERVREEAHRIREAIREARRHARESARSGDETSSASAQPPPKPSASATEPRSHDQEVLRILAAVRAGEMDPDEADDLIRALMEVEGAASGPKPPA